MRPISAVIGLTLLLAACSTTPSPKAKPACPTAPPTRTQAQDVLGKAGQALVTTNKGAFTMQLYGDQAPIATANFVLLARCGFYDGITFHRVLAGFVAQAGDPQTKTNHGDFAALGNAGEGYQYAIEPPADGLTYDKYVVAVANDTKTNDSQFFIDLADLNQQLTRTYTIFAKVISGTDVIDAIGALPVNDPQLGVPLDPAIIQSITIQAAPAASPSSSSGS